MVKKYSILFIGVSLLMLALSGCYGTITGKVVEAETGEPIEGAVVLVEWTVTKGLGLTYTKPYDVIEVVTDKEGKVTISGVFNPVVNPPNVTIYKKGYVAWNNENIFPGWQKRGDFSWANGVIIKLELFKKEYSRSEHVYFLHNSTHWGKLINEAYRWEELEKEGQ